MCVHVHGCACLCVLVLVNLSMLCLLMCSLFTCVRVFVGLLSDFVQVLQREIARDRKERKIT